MSKNFVRDCPIGKRWTNARRNSRAADSGGKGVFIGGPVDWLKHDAEKVEALGMNFVVKNAGSAAAIWAELASGIKQNKAVVVFNWTPNFIEALYDGEFVEFPEHDAKCTEDKSWGINPKALYDCGNPKGGYLKIGVSHGFKKNHAKAFKAAKKINFTNLDVAQQSNFVDTDGMEVDAAADRWLAENKKRWKSGLDNPFIFSARGRLSQ